MIKDEQEYAVSQDALSRFEDSLQRLTNSAGDGDNPVLRQAELEGMRVQIARLQQEIADYETLRLGQTRVIASSSFADLPRQLVQARIALGLSRGELAARLGTTEEEVEDYEDAEYATATASQLAQVAHALGLGMREELYLPIS